MEYANVQNVIMKYDVQKKKIDQVRSVSHFQNEGKSESKIHVSRKSSAREKKRNLGEAINKLQEDNVRLRKKHDLIKYQRKKVSNDTDLLDIISRECTSMEA